MPTITETKVRPLNVIAAEIEKDWKKPYFGAKPYIDAMKTMTDAKEKFGEDDGKEVVMYFLSNATTWRGETARRVKAELKKLAGVV